MLITFTTRARYPDIIMFGDVARTLIRLMGLHDAIPGVIEPQDIPAALQSLREGVAGEDCARNDVTCGVTDGDEEPPVSLHNRASPLVEILEAARVENVPVMWEASGRKF